MAREASLDDLLDRLLRGPRLRDPHVPDDGARRVCHTSHRRIACLVLAQHRQLEHDIEDMPAIAADGTLPGAVDLSEGLRAARRGEP